MISLKGVRMNQREVLEQIKKRFKQFATYGQLYKYNLTECTTDFWGKPYIEIRKAGAGDGITICPRGDIYIVINRYKTDNVLDDIVNSVVWDNRDGSTEVNTYLTTKIYHPGENMEYYIRDQKTIDRVKAAK